MSGSSSYYLESVDDLYFAVLSNENEIFPISDEKYAEELHLQEAIMSSLLFLHPQTNSYANQERKKKKRESTVTERGESSANIQICEICVEPKSMEEIFNSLNCCHVFCSDCISKHIASKIQENIAMVRCPGVSCTSLLEPEHCQSILPSSVFERWADSLSEAAILGSQKFYFYCPFKDCSALLIDERDEHEKVFGESVCPNCNRLFCANCKVPWHSGFKCERLQEFNKDGRTRDDLLFMELAKRENWQKCPGCKYFVKKSEGCLHITCRCGIEFCYSCGARWNSTHKC